MDRRSFVALGAATLIVPNTSYASYAPIEYLPSEWRSFRKENKIALLNFNASWSMTCQLKRETLEQLLSENQDYANSITHLDIDWDTYAFSEWTKAMKVERRSTLVVMKGTREVARLVAEPDYEKVKGLLDTALNAALR